MTEDRKRRLSTLLSAAAVAASLVFVGLEVQQNTSAVRGATMQAMSDASASFMAEMSLNAEFAALVGRVLEGATPEDLTPAENSQLQMNFMALLRMLENTYLQNRLGLVPDAVFESYGWNDGIIGTAYFAAWWDGGVDHVVSDDFQRFFEARVRIGP